MKNTQIANNSSVWPVHAINNLHDLRNALQEELNNIPAYAIQSYVNFMRRPIVEVIRQNGGHIPEINTIYIILQQVTVNRSKETFLWLFVFFSFYFDPCCTSAMRLGHKFSAISAESIYRCMLLFLDHILCRRAHFIREYVPDESYSGKRPPISPYLYENMSIQIY